MSDTIYSLGELFERVQLEPVFPDGKTFVDCTPKSSVSSIHNRYEEEKNKPGFSLTDFVHANFILPQTYSSNYHSISGEPVTEHIEKLWTVLARQPEPSKNSLIELPFPYIVPGGRFREIYYWDSYFTMLGLQVSRRIEMINNMISNFSFLINSFGYIPNGNRTYFLGRSQPPFFSCMIQLLAQEKGEEILMKYLLPLQKEYDFWMRGKEDVSDKKKALHHVVLAARRTCFKSLLG